MYEDDLLVLEKKTQQPDEQEHLLIQKLEEENTKLKLAKEHYEKVFNAVGICILQFTSSGKFLSANEFAIESMLGNDLSNGKSILEKIRLDNQILKAEHLCNRINQDIEVVYHSFDGKMINMGARVTQLDRNQNDSILILTLKDLHEMRIKDQEVKELQNQLVESAYRDGVAENAVSILHNIGNILTTVIGKLSNEDVIRDITLVGSVLKKMSTSLEPLKSQEEMVSFFAHDPLAKAFPKLLSELSKSSAETEKVIVETFESVKVKCINIAEIIAAQQNYANFKDKTRAEISARKIIGDCLVMHKERISKRKIEIELEDFPLVTIFMEKIGFAQTLSNALMNAIEAIDERFLKDPTYKEKKITISSTVVGSQLLIKIADNGIGILPENIAKLFKFGFSTKNRNSGFGLHNCANFMNSNNGKLEITSPGPFLGATTLLYCPISKGV